MKVVAEMRLIVVSALECKLIPSHVFSSVKNLQSMLESLDTAPLFGRQAYVFLKDLPETAITDTQRSGSLRNVKLTKVPDRGFDYAFAFDGAAA